MTAPETPSAKFGELLETVRGAYKKWLGDKYDLGALDAVLSAAAAERLEGDPCWLLVLSGSGAAKTETVMPLEGAGALIVSTISGEAALLSGTSEKDRAADATGGLLCKLGATGLLVVKDVTTIISMSRDSRAEVLAALREVYDGRWNREVGTEGGKTLSWRGKIAVIGAVTTAWDSAHAVISSMGDRFVLVRIDSSENRRAAGLQALRNVGYEAAMREELRKLVGELICSVERGTAIELTDPEMESLLDLADVVTLARTAVEREGPKVVYAHAPEMPTRFTKQLAQIVRGGIALGMDRARAFAVAARCAGDSLPPLRRRILAYLFKEGPKPVGDVKNGLQLPRTTVERGLDELHLLGVLEAREEKWGQGTRNVFAISERIDRSALARLTKNGEGTPGGAKGDGSPPKATKNGDTLPRDGDARLTKNGGTPAEVHPAQLQVPGTPSPDPAPEPPPAKPRAARKPAKAKLPKQKCGHCKKSYTPAKLPSKYCEDRCRKAAHRKKPKETS
ncbi:winged helix-turn-helix domain-containing protein [Nonomuraea cavernae]|uniref:Uncharacterized protein n=1 Tax=Nonomuraea cavernae TaxID=2045107 RepID=A0A917Z1V6_9ACTN|nr:hypothetical protein [Nonomuraea cavernae]MCA2187732.1 hypothetical protein [Nonomuraea cavernae]GGO70669.1 hypothetical protein GCM10012289_34610 [Nonomuraea cavernae]